MARKINVKLIMELRDAGLSRSAIASTRHISRHSVSEVFNIADEKGIHYDDIRALDESEVYRIFYPEKFANETMYGDPDYEHVHQELKKVGVTLKLLHEEYVDRCERNGEIPMGKTKFNKGYAEFTVANRLTNHLEHKPGERAEVDWSGPTMHYVDMSTGELITVYLFVGTLPYSQYSYVEPCPDMKMNTFIRCLVEGAGVTDVSSLYELQPSQIQSMLVSLSERLCLNSRGTLFPIIRQILSYLHAAGFVPADFSGMVLTPAYQNMHLKPYITALDEEKLFHVMKEAPLRTKAMMRLAIRLGIRDIDICNLRFSQIDWQNDQIILEQKKTGVTLSLPLLEDVGNAIMDYIMNERPAEAGSCPYVFVRMQAPYKKLSSMYMVCSGLLDKADIRIVNRDSRGVHVCRYTLRHIEFRDHKLKFPIHL